jgi:hypothetical protein
MKIELLLQMAVGIGNSCCNENLIILMLKCIVKSEHMTLYFLFYTILITLAFAPVENVIASRSPVLV